MAVKYKGSKHLSVSNAPKVVEGKLTDYDVAYNNVEQVWLKKKKKERATLHHPQSPYTGRTQTFIYKVQIKCANLKDI